MQARGGAKVKPASFALLSAVLVPDIYDPIK